MVERLKSVRDRVELVRMRELCRRLQISEWSVRRWTRSPEVRFPHPVRMGSCVAWRWADVEQWLRDQEQQRRGGSTP